MKPKEKTKYQIVVLAAGQSTRGSLPSAMRKIPGHALLIDWLAEAFTPLKGSRFGIVTGYYAREFVGRVPRAELFYNPDWETTGPVASLALVPLAATCAVYVTYADIIFRSSLVKKLEAAKADVVLAIDSQWKHRYSGRDALAWKRAEKIKLAGGKVVRIGKEIPLNESTAEFTGLMRLSPKAAAQVRRLLEEKALPPEAPLPGLIQALIDQKLTFAVVDSEADWAALDAAQDLARFILGTKAESLDRLRQLVTKSVVPEGVTFTYDDWKRNSARAIAGIQKQFAGLNVIVRSSALNEDSWRESLAGKNESIPRVPAASVEALNVAVSRVFDSYGTPNPGDQVLVQPMLENVSCSGVVLTRATDALAPYYVVAFDCLTNRTDTVTSGNGTEVRTWFVLKSANAQLPKEIVPVLEAVREIEGLVGHDCLDIEFAVTKPGEVHLLQVRPLAVGKDLPIDDSTITQAIKSAAARFPELQKPSPFVYGKATLFNVMSDWNPAEIIGTKPNRLALSLYRRLITDETWATQRAQYGYRDVRPCPLIIEILGHPFVDTRASFNSFVPLGVSEPLAEKLVEHYLLRLKDHPQLYDKVEFDILFTCLTADFEIQAKRLYEGGFTRAEVGDLKASLLEVTRRGIARCSSDLSDMALLQDRYRRLKQSPLPPLALAFALLDDVRRVGALNFSHLARAGFIAVAMLRSLEVSGATTSDETEAFLSSLTTVPSRMRQDAWLVQTGERTEASFVRDYGHLRPGTYDITSPRYDSDPDQFLRPLFQQANPPVLHSVFRRTAGSRAKIEDALKEVGFFLTSEELDSFFKSAIEGREQSKFLFTRNLSDAIEIITQWGKDFGVSRHDLKHIAIDEILAHREASVHDIPSSLAALSRSGRHKHYLTEAVCLPVQLTHENELLAFEQMRSVPNYVTRHRVCAPTAVFITGQPAPICLQGKIAVIPSADPGFDWIFAKGIVGLVTQYGGSNSHMAIRASELKLPAAIGVGVALFQKIAAAPLLELDCFHRRIDPIASATPPLPLKKEVA